MYCANVHPTSHIDDLIRVVSQYSAQIKQQRSLNSMYLGGWLNEELLKALHSECDSLGEWKTLLQQHRLVIKTLNAFPQAKFHGQRIKENVYLPDWSMPERLNYTLLLADFIASNQEIFAKHVSISTVPLGYKCTWNTEKNNLATEALLSLAQRLKTIFDTTGVHIRVCLEMEPDCQLESVNDAVSYFVNHLKVNENDFVHKHLGICFDVCHQSVMHENITQTVNKINKAGIVIGKVQISNAIKIKGNLTSEQKEILSTFQQSPYLHQVKIKSPSEHLAFRDLVVSDLEQLAVNADTRIHLHVPIHLSKFAPSIPTTQQQIIEFISCLSTLSYKPDIEVETYTWGILNHNGTNDILADNLIKEIDWLEVAMSEQGLMDNKK